ncbi:DUF3298 and DUF4163 domain-containing protein [Robertkochia flava]|uniref:DUF3298 and DUF4163 domain-containing protein n=1 Tax=Robertkochia flava TaxID=3447986 RepID=UPI001CCED9C5|nr:DUF3298 and DUF4163 domain-containing protein [Robertkochia marina]
MKKKLLIAILLSAVITSCNNSTTLEIVPFSITDQPCDSCARVALNYPQTPGKNRQERKINAELNQWVIRAIDLSADNTPETVEEAVTQFKSAYEQIKNDFPDEYNMSWESTVEGTICYEDNRLFAVCMETYSFTGGAHGYGSSHYLLFDKTQGEIIKKEDLLTDEDGFISLAEKKFRSSFNMEDNLPLNEQGFMFEGDRFHLPNTIGYTQTGLKLIYNPYEIAPYSEGQIVIDIPYEEVNKYLKYQGKMNSKQNRS